MKKLLLLALLLCVPVAPALAGMFNGFELKGIVSSVGGDYDANGQWVATNVLIYGTYDGATWHNRVWCPASGCGGVATMTCFHATGFADQGVFYAETVEVTARTDCF